MLTTNEEFAEGPPTRSAGPAQVGVAADSLPRHRAARRASQKSMESSLPLRAACSKDDINVLILSGRGSREHSRAIPTLLAVCWPAPLSHREKVPHAR